VTLVEQELLSLPGFVTLVEQELLTLPGFVTLVKEPRKAKKLLLH
jgi:hypothetical protein